MARLDEGFTCDSGDHLKVSVSIGIAVIKDDYNTQVEYLIGKADDAMYSVKKSGKSNFAFI
ncbi:MAG: GGDEF domain-containing protein [Ruminococcaceae bacterium]|nr:GGDEF domain-containing protein [Oscillospiraceae bacterium]